MYKNPSPIKPYDAVDALIYAIALTKRSESMSILSPCGTLEIEILDMSDEAGGVHLSIDVIKGVNRVNVLGVHWPEDTPEYINYNDTDKTWFVLLEDWYDRGVSVAVA